MQMNIIPNIYGNYMLNGIYIYFACLFVCFFSNKRGAKPLKAKYICNVLVRLSVCSYP